MASEMTGGKLEVNGESLGTATNEGSSKDECAFLDGFDEVFEQ